MVFWARVVIMGTDGSEWTWSMFGSLLTRLADLEADVVR